MQRRFAAMLRYVAFCNTGLCTRIFMKALNGFLMKQRHMTLKDECGYIMLEENFIGHGCRTLS